MKGLKKIALATAVAAAPFAAQAELQAMDDSMMGNVTGQAGCDHRTGNPGKHWSVHLHGRRHLRR